MPTDEEIWQQIVSEAKEAEEFGKNYCCPICLTWYLTRQEKQDCLTFRHGYEILNIEPKP